MKLFYNFKIFFCIIFLFISSNIFSESQKYIVIDDLNLRTGSSMETSIIRILKKGEIVKELYKNNTWSNIEDMFGNRGYVVSKYLEPKESVETVHATSPGIIILIVLGLIAIIIYLSTKSAKKTKQEEENKDKETIYINL